MINVGPGFADIIGVIANRDLRSLNLRITEGLTPVEQVLNLDASSGRHLRRSLSRGWTCPHQKFFVVRNQPLRPPPCLQQTLGESLSRALSERRMRGRIIDLVGPLT